ncbi:MAG: ComF family protein [Salinivirgaceae bacterium]|nr:ComF family protein [Salinivirgaceae bacterium]
MARLATQIKTLANNFLGLLYPEFCAACNQNLVNQEKVLCTKCLYELPRTYFHKVPGNPIEEIFWGRVLLERVTSFYFFQQGSKYRKLIHKLKYQNQPEIGIELGKHFAADLKTEAIFNEIDLIIPVPLHKKKLKMRGYNQSEMIAQGLAEILPAKLDTKSLIRKTFTQTQTKKNRYERWENIETVFEVKKPEIIEGKHILLVDDVLTTGATLEGCAQCLLKVKNVKVSIATLAFTSLQ